MKLWILMDDEPYGGYFCGQSWKPNMQEERATIREVRVVEDFPDDIWDFILNQGGAPLDEDGSNDSTWLPWWKEAETVWSRS